MDPVATSGQLGPDLRKGEPEVAESMHRDHCGHGLAARLPGDQRQLVAIVHDEDIVAAARSFDFIGPDRLLPHRFVLPPLHPKSRAAATDRHTPLPAR